MISCCFPLLSRLYTTEARVVECNENDIGYYCVLSDSKIAAPFPLSLVAREVSRTFSLISDELFTQRLRGDRHSINVTEVWFCIKVGSRRLVIGRTDCLPSACLELHAATQHLGFLFSNFSLVRRLPLNISHI